MILFGCRHGGNRDVPTVADSLNDEDIFLPVPRYDRAVVTSPEFVVGLPTQRVEAVVGPVACVREFLQNLLAGFSFQLFQLLVSLRRDLDVGHPCLLVQVYVVLRCNLVEGSRLPALALLTARL